MICISQNYRQPSSSSSPRVSYYSEFVIIEKLVYVSHTKTIQCAYITTPGDFSLQVVQLPPCFRQDFGMKIFVLLFKSGVANIVLIPETKIWYQRGVYHYYVLVDCPKVLGLSMEMCKFIVGNRDVGGNKLANGETCSSVTWRNDNGRFHADSTITSGADAAWRDTETHYMEFLKTRDDQTISAPAKLYWSGMQSLLQWVGLMRFGGLQIHVIWRFYDRTISVLLQMRLKRYAESADTVWNKTKNAIWRFCDPE